LRATLTCELRASAPVGWERDFPEEGGRRGEFDGDFDFVVVGQAVAHDATITFFSGSEIHDGDRLAGGDLGAQRDQGTMGVHYQRDGLLGKKAAVRIVAHKHDRNAKGDTLAAAIVGSARSLGCLFFGEGGHPKDIGGTRQNLSRFRGLLMTLSTERAPELLSRLAKEGQSGLRELLRRVHEDGTVTTVGDNPQRGFGNGAVHLDAHFNRVEEIAITVND
jgi:hypothetical protein